jgi:hypothetical protein
MTTAFWLPLFLQTLELLLAFFRLSPWPCCCHSRASLTSFSKVMEHFLGVDACSLIDDAQDMGNATFYRDLMMPFDSRGDDIEEVGRV